MTRTWKIGSYAHGTRSKGGSGGPRERPASRRLALIAAVSVAAVCAACSGEVVAGERSMEATEQELFGNAPLKIQAGSALILHAVTSDDHALYQDGQTLYATKLGPGACRTFVATVPGDNIPQVLQVGKVVFVWTDPQRDLPGFGVSPLVLWTSDAGAELISASSAVGLVATAASSDDRQIVFTTNVTPDGLRGDLVHAKTSRPSVVKTLLDATPLDFPAGRCRPLAGFGGEGAASFPVAAYCAGTDTTATLSKWVHGVKTDLITNIATPLPFRLESDPRATTFLVNRADATLVTVQASGKLTLVDRVTSKQGFVTQTGTVAYTTQIAAAGPTELRLAPRGKAPKTVAELSALFVNRYNRAGYYKRQTTSNDGHWALFGSNLDPATGLLDMQLLDVRSGNVKDLDTQASTFVGNEIFTSDSSHAFFVSFRDPETGTGTLFAANASGAKRLSDDDSVSDALAAEGSAITFSDNTVYDPEREYLLSTVDLRVVDASRRAAQRLVASRANINYWPGHKRRTLVFTSENEPAGPGLYVASARP